MSSTLMYSYKTRKRVAVTRAAALRRAVCCLRSSREQPADGRRRMPRADALFLPAADQEGGCFHRLTWRCVHGAPSDDSCAAASDAVSPSATSSRSLSTTHAAGVAILGAGSSLLTAHNGQATGDRRMRMPPAGLPARRRQPAYIHRLPSAVCTRQTTGGSATVASSAACRGSYCSLVTRVLTRRQLVPASRVPLLTSF